MDTKDVQLKAKTPLNYPLRNMHKIHKAPCVYKVGVGVYKATPFGCIIISIYYTAHVWNSNETLSQHFRPLNNSTD